MSRYLSILSVSSPIDIGIDENNRVMFSLNFEVTVSGPSVDLEQEIVQILENAGLATSGTDTFIGSAAVLPTGNGPYLNIRNTGGTSPLTTHNGDIYERQSVHIVVRASTYTAARTRTNAVWRELDGTYNTTVAA